MTKTQVVSVDGHRIALTNLGKVLYPTTGTTKGDVLAYYAAIAPALIPHAANRPATRKRWVNGVAEESFFQKNLDNSTPAWVTYRTIEHKGHANEYPLVNDLATLTWLGQIATLEIHVPQWQFGRTGTRKNPDRLVLDLDPGEGAGLAECAEVARSARAILVGMGLDPVPVTSGSKGIHLYAALDGTQTSEAISAVAHELARALEADHPNLVVSDMKKSIRDGKVFVDWSQNNASKTTITPYSLRGQQRPTVAAPRTWQELASTALAQLEYQDVLARVTRRGDPLSNLSEPRPDAHEPPTSIQLSLGAAAPAGDRLDKYRSMRDSRKTPEPVPARTIQSSSGKSFVIQEHHAKRLHWDFRLEHDGVLVSWALPKGVPTDTRVNHLAVQTEDHPLEYGSFEGTIPAGEYGGGEVKIWDAGTYELEKWRNDKEIIVTLHGEKRGSHRYALIRTSSDKSKNKWLIHLMDDATKTRRARTVVGPRRPRVRSVQPMLATAGTPGKLSDDRWAFEMKWDGMRVLATITHGDVTLTSRNGIDVSASYPELQTLADTVDADAVIDGEVVALNKGGRPDFGLLQNRMGLTKPADVTVAAKKTKVQFMAFDLLTIADVSLMTKSYDERRAALEEHVKPRGPVQISPVFYGDVSAIMASSLELGLEGVMAKKRDSTYLPGKRSTAWVKLKHHRSQEVVVVGWTPGRGNRSARVGAILVAVHGDDGLSYVGKVGTGFSDQQLETVTAKLHKIERESSPLIDVSAISDAGVRWVQPSLVAEITFTEWTATGRLRHPSFKGWRMDKMASEVQREQ